MEIVEPVRFFAGIALFAVGLVFLWQGRGTRGFNQKKQTAMVAMIGAAILAALGLGYIEFGEGLFG